MSGALKDPFGKSDASEWLCDEHMPFRIEVKAQMSEPRTTDRKTIQHVARRLDLYWRRTCGYQPDADHEVTWHTFVEQAEVAIAAMKEVPRRSATGQPGSDPTA